jgi:hypothetical protein
LELALPKARRMADVHGFGEKDECGFLPKAAKLK